MLKDEVFRSLTITERETLYAALNYIATSCVGHLQWSAKAMLEQRMPDNFLWREGKDLG